MIDPLVRAGIAEPVFDEPPPPADAPAWLHESYAQLLESFRAVHAAWWRMQRAAHRR